MTYVRTARNHKSYTYRCVLYFVVEVGGDRAQTYEKWSFFSIFSRLASFPQVFGQVKECLTLKWHEMIKVLDVVACSMVFFLETWWFEDFSKLHRVILFKYFWPIYVVRYLWSVSSKFWASVAADHTAFYKNCEGIFCNDVINCFYYALRLNSAGTSAQT